MKNIVDSTKTEDARPIEAAQEQRNRRTSGLHKGRFQFLDRRNQMLAGEKNNARRFAHCDEKIADDLENGL
jgi:hypothetical protein